MSSLQHYVSGLSDKEHQKTHNILATALSSDQSNKSDEEETLGELPECNYNLVQETLGELPDCNFNLVDSDDLDFDMLLLPDNPPPGMNVETITDVAASTVVQNEHVRPPFQSLDVSQFQEPSTSHIQFPSDQQGHDSDGRM